MKKTRALILAAGKSTRMKSNKSKVMHTILGKTLIEFVVDALSTDLIERIGLVVADHNIDEIRNVFGDRVDYILQKEQLGTGHALMVARDWLSGFDGSLVVVVGDAPFLRKEIVDDMIKKQQAGESACVLLSAIYDQPPPYGRIVRAQDGTVLRIVEEKDATEDERKIKEVSSSHYCFDCNKALAALKQVRNDNAQNEYYLPDLVEIFIREGDEVEADPVDDPLITFGINSRKEMIYGIREMRQRIINDWIENSVTIIDPESTYIDATVKIGKDSVIQPFSYLADHSQVGANCEIGPFVRISESTIPDGSKVIWTNLERNKKTSHLAGSDSGTNWRNENRTNNEND